MAADRRTLHSEGMSDMRSIRLLIVDDHPVFREALAHALAAAPYFTVVAQANSGSEAVRLWKAHRPDVTLMDVSMEGVDGVAAVEGIRREAPDARVLMLTSSNASEDAGAALAAGAAGYITKSVGFVELMDAIREVHAGGRPVAPTLAKRLETREKSPLSLREMEVLELLRDGLSQDQIHHRLAIADRTVRVHVAAIKEKLGAASTAHCVTRAFELGILSPSTRRGGAALVGSPRSGR
jgi:DNA-binding NarL/FixJ family response regulator